MKSWASIASSSNSTAPPPTTENAAAAAADDDIVVPEGIVEADNNNSSSTAAAPVAAVQKMSLAQIMAEQNIVSQKEREQQEQQRLKQQEQEKKRMMNQEEIEVMMAIQASLGASGNTASSQTPKDAASAAATQQETAEVDDPELQQALELSKQMMMQEQQKNNDNDEDDSKKPAAKSETTTQAAATAAASASVTDTCGAASTSVTAAVVGAVAASAPSAATAASGVATTATSAGGGMSAEELEQIERALREADDAEAAKSLQLAMALQKQEDQNLSRDFYESIGYQRSSASSGHVRVMTRRDFMNAKKGIVVDNSANAKDDIDDDFDDTHDDDHNAGYRCNQQSTTTSKNDSNNTWSRVDRDIIMGPNNEIRTKHDPILAGRSNAHRLGLTTTTGHYDDDDGDDFVITNKVYNSFKQSMKSTKKGVAVSGVGRANRDTNKTHQGAMDEHVRLHITHAINNGLIEHCNGVIKEGKEALVYHAQKANQTQSIMNDNDNNDNNNDSTNKYGWNGGFDVAIKVFKRISEFKNRSAYIVGDPRYGNHKVTTGYNNTSSREQLQIWTEKEYRNLVRANRSGVPVPTPIHTKDNILFMRFLGTAEGWPYPQLKELTSDIKRGSSKWTTLYNQTMIAISILYHNAKLVHADLSEYNILVCPTSMVENQITDSISDPDALQIVLIDFGQAVDIRHPNATKLLERDLHHIKQFFDKMGIKTMTNTMAQQFVTNPETVQSQTCFNTKKIDNKKTNVDNEIIDEEEEDVVESKENDNKNDEEIVEGKAKNTSNEEVRVKKESDEEEG